MGNSFTGQWVQFAWIHNAGLDYLIHPADLPKLSGKGANYGRNMPNA